MATPGLTSQPSRRWWWAGGAGVVLIVAVVLFTFLGRSGSGGSGAYPTRTATVGAVSVSLQLVNIDTTSATVDIAFDTHSGALNLDVARQSRLVVAGTVWPAAKWSGDGPGGHHRHGQLTFSGSGAATGTVTVTLTGLSRPVTASWQVTP